MSGAPSAVPRDEAGWFAAGAPTDQEICRTVEPYTMTSVDRVVAAIQSVEFTIRLHRRGRRKAPTLRELSR